MNEAQTCGDNRLEIIAKAKKAILEATNIETSPNEMAVLGNILFRCWQMGWLDKYDDSKTDDRKWIPTEENFPPEDTKVIVTDGESIWIDEFYCCYCSGAGEELDWQWDCGMDWLGTAWMPLPKLPEWKKERA